MHPRTETPPIGTMVSVGGTEIHVREDGSAGPRVLLLHGFSGSMHWYDEVAARLAAEHRVLRVDLRGHGGTGGNSGLDPRAQAHLIAGLLDQLDATAVTAVGHSFGADVALELARASRRVHRIVIIDQAPDYSFATLPPGASILGLPGLGTIVNRYTPAFLIKLFMRNAFAPGFDAATAFDDPGRVIADTRATAGPMYREVGNVRRSRLAATPLDQQVAAAGLPTLVIHGRHDALYDCAATVARYEAVGAHTHVIEDAGHSPNVEQPEAVAQALATFAGS
ncbi:alpha/beta hydrolase [Nocardia sp. NPDC050712]|uniref:alpha/beta fold hydrolase n=1 Tax=Nocardia sp. NPDC050712 TaxID=3155518 RepID=UPI0033FD020B